MENKMIEIILNEDDNYKFYLLRRHFIISLFYNDRYIDPGTLLVVRAIIDKENNVIYKHKCRCVSHDNGRLVLV